MERIGIHDARARLSELVDRVAAGEAFVLTRYGKPVARLTGAGLDERMKARSMAVAGIRSLSKKLKLNISPAELRKVIAGR